MEIFNNNNDLEVIKFTNVCIYIFLRTSLKNV